MIMKAINNMFHSHLHDLPICVTLIFHQTSWVVLTGHVDLSVNNRRGLSILVPRAYDPSGLWLGSRALAGPDFLLVRRVFVSHCQPIRFARFDGKSVNRGLPVLDQNRALDPNHRPEGSHTHRLWGRE